MSLIHLKLGCFKANLSWVSVVQRGNMTLSEAVLKRCQGDKSTFLILRQQKLRFH